MTGAVDRTDRSAQAWRSTVDPWKVEVLSREVVGPRVLDVGCGYGAYSRLLAQRGFDVVSVDRAEHPECPPTLVRADATALPFDDATFDTVIAFDVMEHLDDDGAFLDGVRRICRRRLILSVPNDDDRALTPYGLTYKHHRDKTHRREYRADSLLSLLAAHGFKPHLIERPTPFPVGILPTVAARPWKLPVRVAVRLSRALRAWRTDVYLPDLFVSCEVG